MRAGRAGGRARGLGVALLAVGVLLGGAGCVAAPEPAPSSADPSRPGAVLDVGPWAGEAPAGSVVQSVTFRTLDVQDRAVSSHALVISPTTVGAAAGRILVWEHGTTGAQAACSPSAIPGWLTGGAVPGLDELLRGGWTVVAPDLADPRTDRPMPYLVGEGEARASLDAVRATRELSGGALDAGFAVWGHSQGGHAALWTASTAASYAPELTVRAVAAFAPAVDPGELIAPTAPPVAAALLGGWIAAGYDAWYGDDSATKGFDPALAPVLEAVAAGCLGDPPTAELTAGLEQVAAGAVPVGVRDSASLLRRRLAGNTATTAPGTPTFVAWGEADDVVAPASLERWAAAADGTALEARPYPGLDHGTVVGPDSAAVADALAWTTARLPER
ncbi:lipase family protein [Rathayibacter sp. VKM Ac-2927]|uniref:lipase family protein n=1 Tax=Rathayibacter sp. VKM Ac-2927 TaxID=2929478 RepID=UPI001FB2A364|nr:lipase family protein [Rathayibacter sp. VKM Ac-2927]MCJ1688113.1 lipase family protein [Rathayibacter sp. VKM Ac-2927]